MIANGPSEIFNLALGLVIVSLIVATGLNRAPRKRRQATDGPKDKPYRIYTRDFDSELRPAEIEERLKVASPDYALGHYHRSREVWDVAIDRRDAIERTVGTRLKQRVTRSNEDVRAATFSGSAVTLLIDQSGSMKGEPIAHVAAVARLLTGLLTELGARVEVLGFSTAGWRGGFAYQQWLGAGSPRRPGRLCALAHIIYKTHDEPVTADSFDAMLNPDLLRENIDGEAILWAVERLTRRAEARRVLIVISDGAPVDDATLMHNGPCYLTRHVKQVINQIEADRAIVLAALGINHSVGDWYTLNAKCDRLDELPDAVGELLERIASAA